MSAAKCPWSVFLATGFYSGYAPKAPGTAGTAVMAVLCWIAFQLWPDAAQWPVLVIITAAVFVLGVLTANRVVDSGIFVSDPADARQAKDPKQVVIDEFAGYLVTLVGMGRSPGMLVAAFFAFRFFDILKPFPVNRVQKLKGGAGVVVDDLVAGVFANLVLTALVFASRHFGAGIL